MSVLADSLLAVRLAEPYSLRWLLEVEEEDGRSIFPGALVVESYRPATSAFVIEED